MEDENATLLAKVQTSAADSARISKKLEDLENRSRRNNLRLIGLPESIPTNEPMGICEIDLPAILDKDRHCRVDRLHPVDQRQKALLSGPRSRSL